MQQTVTLCIPRASPFLWARAVYFSNGDKVIKLSGTPFIIARFGFRIGEGIIKEAKHRWRFIK